jgi:hypothetical protein
VTDTVSDQKIGDGPAGPVFKDLGLDLELIGSMFDQRFQGLLDVVILPSCENHSPTGLSRVIEVLRVKAESGALFDFLAERQGNFLLIFWCSFVIFFGRGRSAPRLSPALSNIHRSGHQHHSEKSDHRLS